MQASRLFKKIFLKLNKSGGGACIDLFCTDEKNHSCMGFADSPVSLAFGDLHCSELYYRQDWRQCYGVPCASRLLRSELNYFSILLGLDWFIPCSLIYFVPSPKELIDYLLGKTKAGLGHNPLGALSVLGLLFSVGLQAVTGLFANDDIAFEGPFAKYVSNDTVQLLTSIHHINENILIILIALHLCAIVYYQKFKGENLIKPMLVGDKEIDPSEQAKYLPSDLGQASRDGGLQRGLALLLLSLLALILVYFIKG